MVVISRTPSFRFKNQNTYIRKIGDMLNVNYVLEGNVRKDKEKLCRTAQLIEVQSCAQVWALRSASAVNEMILLRENGCQACQGGHALSSPVYRNST